MFEDAQVEVKTSPIEGLGVFAKRDFKEGEVVLTWHPQKITSGEEAALSKEERARYINTLSDGTRVLMAIPERYINHSDDPNTKPKDGGDIAIRGIKKGEEITSSYLK